jgi:hypothetical protein
MSWPWIRGLAGEKGLGVVWRWGGLMMGKGGRDGWVGLSILFLFCLFLLLLRVIEVVDCGGGSVIAVGVLGGTCFFGGVTNVISRGRRG